MAKSVTIQREEASTRIFLDGTEVKDVVSYHLEENALSMSAFLTMKIEVANLISISGIPQGYQKDEKKRD